MERIVRRGLLYDFYGELLTAHQREVYEGLVLNDMSLSEIADEQGVSRQAVHDLIKRCDRILSGYEEKLGLIARFQETKKLAEEIRSISHSLRERGNLEELSGIEAAAEKIMDL